MIRRIRTRLNERTQHEMARFGGGRDIQWSSLFKEQLEYVNEGVEKLIDSLQLVSDEEPHDCLQDAADGVEYIVDFIRDYGAEDLTKRDFAKFDLVTVSTKQERDGRTLCNVKLKATLGNLQERINDYIETGSKSKSTRDLVWYAFTSCRSNRNSGRDNTANFEVDLTMVYR